MENINIKHYDNMRTPPNEALKKIQFGALKGMSDINPQWRYEIMTKEFGVCGIGWKFEVVDAFTKDLQDGQVMVFVKILLYIKENELWSDPMPSFGGDYLIKKDKNGIHGNDEAYKMATTDALGTAMKMLGVAADVYRGINDTKYDKQSISDNREIIKTVSSALQQEDGKHIIVGKKHNNEAIEDVINVDRGFVEWVANTPTHKLNQVAIDLLKGEPTPEEDPEIPI